MRKYPCRLKKLLRPYMSATFFCKIFLPVSAFTCVDFVSKKPSPAFEHVCICVAGKSEQRACVAEAASNERTHQVAGFASASSLGRCQLRHSSRIFARLPRTVGQG